MVSFVNFKYFDLNNIIFKGTDEKSGGVILLIGDNQEDKMQIVKKIQILHNIKTIHYGINPSYIRNKINEEKLEREFIITDLTDANNYLDILSSAGHYRILIFILMKHIRKINYKLIERLDYVFCQSIMEKEAMDFLYNNFIYMFKHSWDFFKFVFMQIKKNDWIIVCNSKNNIKEPEDYIYFYNNT